MSATHARTVRKIMALLAAGTLALTGAGVIVLSTAQSAAAADLTITSPEGAYPGIQLAPTLTVAGTADAGELITVTSGLAGATDCQATADAGGAWSCDITNMPNTNAFSISAERPYTGGVDFASKPVRGVLLPPVVTSANPMLTNASTTTVTGNFAISSGETVTVDVDFGSGLVCSTTSNYITGDWSCTMTLPEGTYVGVPVTQTVSYGAATTTSNPTYIDVVVDYTAPPTPTILSPGESYPGTTPTYYTSDLSPTVSGTGEPGTTTWVTYGADSSQQFMNEFCATTVDPGGSWSCPSPTTFAVDEHIMLAVYGTDSAGNSSLNPEGVPAMELVFLPAPDAPEFSSPTDGYSSANPYVYFSGFFTGPSYPVTVLVNGEPTCEPTMGEGDWNCSGGPYAPGSYTATVFVTDGDGTQSAGVSRSFTIEQPALSDPSIDSPSGSEGGVFSSVTTPLIQGTAVPNATVTVLYHEGIGSGSYGTYCTTSADESGYYACSGIPLVPEQSYTFGAQQVGPLGNESPGTAELMYYTVLAPPSTPTVDTPSGGYSAVNPYVYFSGFSNYPVSVLVNGSQTCEVSNGEGDWSCTGGPYAPGSYTATIVATNWEGTQSEPVFRAFTIEAPFSLPTLPDPVPVTVPTPTFTPTPTPTPSATPPALEVVLAITDKAGTDLTGKPIKAGQTVVITGSGAPAGATAVIELHSDPITLGSTTAKQDGTFSLTALIPKTIEPGEHHFVAIVTPAGQASATFETVATIEPPDEDPAPEKASEQPDRDDVIAFLAGLGGSAGNGFDSPSSFTSSLKTATEFRLTPALLGAAGLIAAAFLLLVAFPAELLESTVRANYDRVFGWVAPIKRRLGRIGHAIKRIPVNTWVATVGIIALTALILGFSDPGFGFNGSSVRLWIALVVSIVLLNVVLSTIVMSVAKRKFSAPGTLVPMPAALILVVLSVLISRIIGIQPGFLFGVVLGVAFAIELKKRQDALLVLLGIGLSLVIGVAAWLGYTALATSGAAEPGFWHLLAQETLAATTVEALATMTVALLPLTFLDGKTLFEWNKWVWAGTYIVAIVAFVVVILPLSDNWGQMSAPLLGWGAFFAGFAVLAVGIWAVFRFMPMKVKPAA
ncbi:MAG: hypothetical protein JWP85_531 [Rhodoglobus sp.]|nr:hypothetical protein [Rhodoglobus sp.]